MSKKIIMYLSVLMLSAASIFAQSSRDIVVGSKIDTEGTLLGKMIVQVLKSNGIAAVDKSGFGTTDVVRKAIVAKEIDIYPEYTGNGGFFFANTDPGIWKNAQKGYEMVKKLDFAQNKLVWLTPSPANNTWAIAIRNDVAMKANLNSLDDLAKYLKAGGDFKLVGSEEFLSRADALPAFQSTYGFMLKPNQVVSISGGNTALTEKAAAQGTDGVNAAMAYGTDGSLAALGLTVLTDSKGVQPVYQPAPLVRQDVLSANPKIANLLKPVFLALDLKTLQTLNARIAVNGESADAVAKDWLLKKGFIK